MDIYRWYIIDAHRGGICEEAFVHKDEFFGKIFLRLFAIAEFISDAVVHGLDTGRVGVTAITDLDRCWFESKGIEAVITSMPGEVNQDVDIMRLDKGFKFGAIKIFDDGPMAFFKHILKLDDFDGIAMNIKEVIIDMVKNAMDEICDGVTDEISRDKADI